MAEDYVNSTAKSPDLDWSQVKETVLMLNLAVAQIEKTLNEGDDSINTLMETFSSLVGGVQAISMAAENLRETPEKETILANVEPAAEKINSAIVAFQFYDKLTQRLNHVSNSLDALGKLIESPVRLYNPYEWHGLQAMIKSKYTIEQDRKMFEAILNGSTVAEVLSEHNTESPVQDDDNDNDVELF